MPTISERLDEISDELDQLESPEAAYQRGLDEARQEWNWTMWFFHTVASVLGAFLIFVAVCGIWNFIHWAAQPDHHTQVYCTLDTSGQQTCKTYY